MATTKLTDDDEEWHRYMRTLELGLRFDHVMVKPDVREVINEHLNGIPQRELVQAMIDYLKSGKPLKKKDEDRGWIRDQGWEFHHDLSPVLASGKAIYVETTFEDHEDDEDQRQITIVSIKEDGKYHWGT